ncbi:MAG: hypothetical protein A2V88_12315 [Elusimicrobia bacterium RBG_16_66_12]|nr:MAG: hypothetical protein A2V88_12315 [Elusimicrobia bacterium RBG_16_66_12]
MARIVLTGTATKLRRLRAADLPADRDLRNSYLRYVDLSGFDLSIYDMRDTDIIDCVGRGVILPDFAAGDLQATDYMQSRRTDWTGAKIPAIVSSYNHDLVVEVLRQAIPSLSGVPLQAAQVVANYVSGDYARSWRDGYWQVMDKLGLDVDGVLANVLPAFKGYPKLESRLRHHHDSGRISPVPPGFRSKADDFEFSVDGVNTVRENIAVALVGKYDRYALRQTLRTAIRTKYAGWTTLAQHYDIWFAQLDPYPIFFWRDANMSPDLGDDWHAGWPT